MGQLVAYYDSEPVEVSGKVEIEQVPLAAGASARSVEGVVRPKLVYVRIHGEAGPFLVPFGAYDDWSLRDRYNEAIRIMNTLGAATITCESFAERAARRRLGIKLGRGAQVSKERIENSGFDFHHDGAGSAPRDPRPLRWPQEPGFEAAISSVLDNGATAVEINIKINRTHAIDGELGLQFKAIGFDLGGGTERSEATSLHIRATFPQARRGWR